MRIRSLKPGFFTNEDLCAFSPWHRLAFAGLWCCADREGRLEDRPKRLHAKIFPYDHDLNFDALLWDLAREVFIRRYRATSGHRYIDIPSWGKNQFPRPDERPSELPEFEHGQSMTGVEALGPAIVVPVVLPVILATDLPVALISGVAIPEPAENVDLDRIVKIAPQVTAGQGVTKIDTDPSLRSDCLVSAQRSVEQMGNGIWDLGSGILESRERERTNAIVEDAIADRGARLLERYQVLYQEHRHGAHYRPRPNLDWLDACDLCRHWDDARLDKLAAIVLTTDDPFISKTDRSFKIFALKASWADDRLCQWEGLQPKAGTR